MSSRRWLDRAKNESRLIENRMDCRESRPTCTTVLHGSVYRQTSTPHHGGNTQKRNKKKFESVASQSIAR